MPIGAGYPFICGSDIESVHGTAVTVKNRVPVRKESLTDAIKLLADDTLRGLAGHDTLDLAEISVAGDVETDVRYTLRNGSFFCGSDLWLSLAMGGAPAFNNSISTLLLSESPSRPATIAFDKQVSYWEFVSCMFKGFKLLFKVGEPLTASFPLVAHRLLRTGTTNGAAQFNALAANGGKRVLGSDVTFRLGAISGGALAAAHAIGLSDATLDYNAGMSDPEFSSPDAGVAVGGGTHGDNTTTRSQRLTLPVVRNDRRSVLLEFNAPRYLSNQLFTWRDAATELQFDAATSIDSAARTFRLLVPRLILESVDANVDGPGIIPVKCKARCLFNGGTSSGGGVNSVMTNSVPTTNKIPEEFQLELKNSADGRTAAIWT